MCPWRCFYLDSAWVPCLNEPLSDAFSQLSASPKGFAWATQLRRGHRRGICTSFPRQAGDKTARKIPESSPLPRVAKLLLVAPGGLLQRWGLFGLSAAEGSVRLCGGCDTSYMKVEDTLSAAAVRYRPKVPAVESHTFTHPRGRACC